MYIFSVNVVDVVVIYNFSDIYSLFCLSGIGHLAIDIYYKRDTKIWLQPCMVLKSSNSVTHSPKKYTYKIRPKTEVKIKTARFQPATHRLLLSLCSKWLTELHKKLTKFVHNIKNINKR